MLSQSCMRSDFPIPGLTQLLERGVWCVVVPEMLQQSPVHGWAVHHDGDIHAAGAADSQRVSSDDQWLLESD